MRSRLRGLLARPLGEQERRRAFVVATVVLLGGAVSLSLARPHPHPHLARRARTAPPTATSPGAPAPRASAPSPPPGLGPRTPSPIPTPDGGRLSGTAPAEAMAAGRAFLFAYLRFSYGQAPPGFPDAAPALADQLARFHVAVGPALKRRRLSLLALRAGPANGGYEVGALASDGVSRFPVAAIVKPIGGRWLAVRVVTAGAGP